MDRAIYSSEAPPHRLRTLHPKTNFEIKTYQGKLNSTNNPVADIHADISRQCGEQLIGGRDEEKRADIINGMGEKNNNTTNLCPAMRHALLDNSNSSKLSARVPVRQTYFSSEGKQCATPIAARLLRAVLPLAAARRLHDTINMTPIQKSTATGMFCPMPHPSLIAR